jgi:hypothetical protein
MLKYAPRSFQNSKCWQAVLSETNINAVIGKASKIDSSKAKCKSACALAILKCIKNSDGLAIAGHLPLREYLRVFIFYCSVEFSWRGIFNYIYGSNRFDQFLEEMGMLEDVRDLHKDWVNQVDSDNEPAH